MQSTLPPYAIPPLGFPFRHLAAQAGRAPIGGGREVALACFLAARLAGDRLSAPLPDGARAGRGVGARGWLSTLALPAPMRIPVANCLEMSVTGTPAQLAEAVGALSAAAAGYLEPAARGELDHLVTQLTG